MQLRLRSMLTSNTTERIIWEYFRQSNYLREYRYLLSPGFEKYRLPAPAIQERCKAMETTSHEVLLHSRPLHWSLIAIYLCLFSEKE